MPANGTFSTSTGLDIPTKRIARAVPYFVGTDSEGGETLNSGPMWKCTQVHISAGAKPSYADIVIPLQDLHEIARAVVGIGGSAHDLIKCNQKCVIKEYIPGVPGGSIKLLGKVIDIDGEIHSDMVSVRIEDARYDLLGIPLIGSWWADQTGTYCYRQAWPAHYNRGGYPNCRFVDGLPWFCHENYGLSDGQPVPSPSAKSSKFATHWTPRTVLEQIRWALTEGVTTARDQGHPEYCGIDEDWIDFPQEAVSALDDMTLGEKKAPEWPLDGTNALHAILELIRFRDLALVMQPGQVAGKFVNRIAFAPSRFAGQGSTVACASQGEASAQLANPNVVTRGTLRESIRNAYSSVVAVGATTFIEQRVGTDGNHLKMNFPDDHRKKLGDKIKALYNLVYTVTVGGETIEYPYYSFQDCCRMAFRQFPNYGRVFYIDPAWDFQGSTPEDGRHLAKVSRPVLPYILTTVLANNSGQDSDSFGNTAQKRPVMPEIYVHTEPPTPADPVAPVDPTDTGYQPTNPTPGTTPDDGSGYQPTSPQPQSGDEDYDPNGGYVPAGDGGEPNPAPDTNTPAPAAPKDYGPGYWTKLPNGDEKWVSTTEPDE